MRMPAKQECLRSNCPLVATSSSNVHIFPPGSQLFCVESDAIDSSLNHVRGKRKQKHAPFLRVRHLRCWGCTPEIVAVLLCITFLPVNETS